jgi:hypothetical protein
MTMIRLVRSSLATKADDVGRAGGIAQADQDVIVLSARYSGEPVRTCR